MLARWGHDRFRSVIARLTPQLSSRLHGSLGNQMKVLNEREQFTKFLHLFDECRMNDTHTLSNMIIMQALKASTNLRALQRGIGIHPLISDRVQNDSYFAASLIHLYSKSTLVHSCLVISTFEVQCGEVTRAEVLFGGSTNKAMSMYGAMMTGDFRPLEDRTRIESLLSRQATSPTICQKKPSTCSLNLNIPVKSSSISCSMPVLNRERRKH